MTALLLWGSGYVTGALSMLLLFKLLRLAPLQDAPPSARTVPHETVAHVPTPAE